MARITIQDCRLRVGDDFELVVLAAHRARQVNAGSPLTVPRDNDKDHVVALREIAKGSIDLGALRKSFLSRFQRYVEAEEEEDEFLKSSASPSSADASSSQSPQSHRT